MSAGLGVEALLFTCGAQHDTPPGRGKTQVIRCMETPRLRIALTFNCPFDIGHRKLVTLSKEMIRLERSLLVPVGPLQIAQRGHVLGNRLARLPGSKTPIANDTGWDAVEVCDAFTVEAIERVAILFEEDCYVTRHGQRLT